MTAPATVAPTVTTLMAAVLATRHDLQQDRRPGGDDDQQREPGNVIHRAMNTHTTTSTTANTVKIEA